MSKIAVYRSATLAGVAMLALAGCATPDEQRASQAACPQVAIIRGLSHLAVMDDPGSTVISPAKLVYSAEMGDVKNSCEVADKGIMVKADLGVHFAAGPSAPRELNDRNAVATLPYFVAAIGPNNQVLSKQMFTLAFDMRQDLTDTVREPVQIMIPGTTGQVTQVLIGFQLTPQQQRYNDIELAAHGMANPGAMAPVAPAAPVAPSLSGDDGGMPMPPGSGARMQ